MIASKTGWSYDYILRSLPIAAGLQLILWHDRAADRKMIWSVPMKERHAGNVVDIATQMKQAITLSDHEDYSDS